MTLDEIKALLAREEVRFLEFLVLKMPMPKTWLGNFGYRSNQVTTPFGWGKPLYPNGDGTIAFSIEKTKVEKWVRKTEKSLSNQPK